MGGRRRGARCSIGVQEGALASRGLKRNFELRSGCTLGFNVCVPVPCLLLCQQCPEIAIAAIASPQCSGVCVRDSRMCLLVAGEEKRVVIDADDGIRAGATPASLGQLKPVFKKGGTTTAGNSSQVTDGAAATMLMTRREAVRRGLPILGIFRRCELLLCSSCCLLSRCLSAVCLRACLHVRVLGLPAFWLCACLPACSACLAVCL